MNIREKIIDRFAGDLIEARVKAEVEKIKASLPTLGYVEPDDWKYRKLTRQSEVKDLAPLVQDKMLRIAYYLYDANGFAKRLLEQTKDAVIGEGLSIEAEDERVQEVIDAFWEDPINLMDLKLPKKILELGMYGEQCYPVFVNEKNGHVRLGYLDPINIGEVIANKENIEILEEVVHKPPESGGEGKHYKVIRLDEDPGSRTFGLLTGECFFFSINNVSNSTRGRSDLLPHMDWLDHYENSLYTAIERFPMLFNFIWDVLIKGGNEETIKKFLTDNGPPNPNSIRAHNESIEWDAVAPDIKSADITVLFREIRNYILGGQGRPEHWFAWGESANRATALEMGDPVYKSLSQRQKLAKYMVEHILSFVRDQAIIHKRLPKKVDPRIWVNMPEISAKDVKKIADSLLTMGQGLSIAQLNKWISTATATEIFSMVASQLGVEISASEEQEAIELEKGLEEIQDYLPEEKLRAAMALIRKIVGEGFIPSRIRGGVHPLPDKGK